MKMNSGRYKHNSTRVYVCKITPIRKYRIPAYKRACTYKDILVHLELPALIFEYYVHAFILENYCVHRYVTHSYTVGDNNIDM